MNNQTEQVDQFLSRLDHPMKTEIEQVRRIILSANEEITEHIKWNAPSFCYKGEDRVTFNLHAKDGIQLIFHRGAKSKESAELKSSNPSNLLKWITTDRAKVELKDMADVEANRSELARLVNTWISTNA